MTDPTANSSAEKPKRKYKKREKGPSTEKSKQAEPQIKTQEQEPAVDVPEGAETQGNDLREQEAEVQVSAPTAAKLNPVVGKKIVDPREFDEGGADHVKRFIDLPYDADEFEPASPRIITEGANEAEIFRLRDKEANMEFSREILYVEISAATEKNPMAAFSVSVNGEEFTLRYGGKYRMPRYAVEGLMRARPVNYGNVEYLDEQGDRAIKHPSSRSVRFPFQIRHDPSPDKSAAWQRSVMNQQ